jgi:hypothetical protein
MLSKISIMAGLVAATLTMGCRNSRETDLMGQPRAVEGTDEITPGTPGMTGTMDDTTISPSGTASTGLGTTDPDPTGADTMGAGDQGARDLDPNEDADTTSRSGAGDTSGAARSAEPNVRSRGGTLSGTGASGATGPGTMGTTGITDVPESGAPGTAPESSAAPGTAPDTSTAPICF